MICQAATVQCETVNVGDIFARLGLSVYSFVGKMYDVSHSLPDTRVSQLKGLFASVWCSSDASLSAG